MERVLLVVSELIYRSTWAAWMKLARRSLVGDLLARLRTAEERAARFEAECVLLRTRLAKIDPGCRPHFPKHARFDILVHIRRWGLTLCEAAAIFMVTPETISRWGKALEQGKAALVASRRALNRLPDLTRELVHRLRLEQAAWGTRRICQVLVRLGLKLSRPSVQRVLREAPPNPRRRPTPSSGAGRGPVVAYYPMHVAMIDFTSVRLPLIREIWIGAVVDVFSRKILAIRAWARVPTATDARQLFAEAVRLWGTIKYLIADHGTQFTARVFKRFLKRHGILRRYGAVARPQSVSIVDRTFGSLKRECAGRWILLLPLTAINAAVARYAVWHARFRPHQGLGGLTPDEVFSGRRRRRPREGELHDVRRTLFRGDERLPIYRRVLAA